MDDYIRRYGAFNKTVVYDFKLGSGGIGDNIKFFMFLLETCMKNNWRVCYKKNNIPIEQFLKLRYNIMYIEEPKIKQLRQYKVVTPFMLYSSYNYNYSIDINQVFYFTEEVKLNGLRLLPQSNTDYISIHLRLGDKYLETDKKYVVCSEDVRTFSEESIHQFIKGRPNEPIFFCCDNNRYKVKMKETFTNLIITNCDIGHTSLQNTTRKQVLDGITELYLLTNSKMIFAGASSGFSIIASKFNNIPLL